MLDEEDSFGAGPLPEVVFLRRTNRYPIRFKCGHLLIEANGHAVERAEERGVSWEEVGWVLSDKEPVYYKGSRPRKFRKGSVGVVAKPLRYGWHIVTCYRWNRRSRR